MELFDLTQKDARWSKRKPEINRVKELFVDAVLCGTEYKTTLQDLDKYFMQFAIIAMR